jgi:DNA polymerase-1
MAKKLFLLDGMALVYRAHFAFISRPILTSKGVNTSALFGFTQTLLDILGKQQPTHMAVAFDTAAPTRRHTEYADYKATREAMPEELSEALPSVRRMIEAFRIPVLSCDGFEADDIIGTLAMRAEAEGFECYMVTPDKDFGQLITDKTFIYKPGRAGDAPEILGVPEIKARWGIQSPEQVVDVLALMGDSTDNIPGVPGIGEKTAMKLIGQFGTVENLLAHTGELTGRVKENLGKHAEDAKLSKRLATIDRDVPCEVELESLKVELQDDDKLKALLVEFEFNSIGRRLFGEDFKAGRGFALPAATEKTPPVPPPAPKRPKPSAGGNDLLLDFGSDDTAVEPEPTVEPAPPAAASHLKTIKDVAHDYQLASTKTQRTALIAQLKKLESFCFDTETTGLDSKEARLVGIAFSFAPHTGHYVAVPQNDEEAQEIVEEFRSVLESEKIEKVGHNLKFDLGVLKRYGVNVGARLWDTMVAHSLIEPDLRHGMDFLSEVYLGYTPVPITALIGDEGGRQINMSEVPIEKVAEYAAEDADVTWQLRAALEPLLKGKGQERVFYEVESPLIPALMAMEHEGIKVDAAALEDFAAQLAKEIDQLEKKIHLLAGEPFNLNSARQLGQVLFEQLKIGGAPKKTRTGQYATDEQTLTALASDHEIVRLLLEYRGASKLKSTYADALPQTIRPSSGRVHTTFNQVVTATGRLNSQDPNLQNIPIRTEKGREIRRAFVPRGKGYKLLSADYSQIELRIIAALSKEAGLLEAFQSGADVHTATAARVFGVMPALVTSEMRRKAKMVNYGIAYGISAFGLSQRLGIPRKEGSAIIGQYFAQFPGIRRYMDETIAFAREHGFVQTVTGRRRYLRDIRSANNTIRSAAERTAINAPIQGTAADMIKIAMVQIHQEIWRRKLKSAMLLQVHDELVFDLFMQEEKEVHVLVEDKMTTALPLDVPIVVEMGVGENWLEAH